MNKIVKFLLVILAILIIAGAGFWGGTQFAYRQVAINAANQTAATSPRVDGTGRGPNTGNRGWSDEGNSQRGNNGRDNFGPGMMGRNNFGPGMMGQNNYGNNMMNGSFGGFPGVFHGGLFGGGFMLLGLIFPLGILVLIVLGIIALLRIVKRPSATVTTAPDSTVVCPKCGSPVQTGWTHCAACGEVLE
jgi:hypothetical protein